MKKLKDYINFYPNTPIILIKKGKIVSRYPNGINSCLDLLSTERKKWDEKKYKPVLRRISSMTKEEFIEFNNQSFNTTPHKKKSEESIFIEAERTMWLLSRNFDLFGLIDSGLAFDENYGTIK